MIRRALFLSDLHLGWAVCTPSHRALLDSLPEAAGDAELIVLNGDIIDAHRGVHRGEERALIDRLVEQCAAWRRDGRTVVIVEGNHDPDPSPLGPVVWRYVFEGAHGERVLVLHGHRFDDAPFAMRPYEAWGRHVTMLENLVHARATSLRAAYPYAMGWFVGAWGLCEDRLWRPRFPGQLAPLLDGDDRVGTIVHGHFHFGPGRTEIAGRPAWKTGAWVARGHLGTVDRMLRYRDGTWERLGLVSGRIVPVADGR